MPAELEPVSFKKPVTPQPRLSAPYVPGRHSSRFWSEAEERVLRENFEVRGAPFCRGMLPGRPIGAIYQHARKLGLKRRRSAPVLRAPADPEPYDAKLREMWPDLAGKGAFTRFADELGVPRWWLSKRAREIGLTAPRYSKEPPWSTAELALLRRIQLDENNLEHAARIFRRHGFNRTPTALKVKAKREGLSRRYGATLSQRAAARILGVDDKTVARWMQMGLLRAMKRKTRRLPQQGGDPWSVERGELRRFVLENLDALDIRKVEKFAFVDLLVNVAAPATNPARRRRPRS